MNSIVFENIPEDYPQIKSLKKSLKRRFKLTKWDDVASAILVANYLFAVGKIKEAAELLDPFVTNFKYDPEREDLWGANGDGIVLLAYMSRLKGDTNKEKQLLNILLKEDIVTDSCTRYELLQRRIESLEPTMAYARTEKPKYKCGTFSAEAFQYLYFREMLEIDRGEAPEGLDVELDNIIASIYDELKHAIIDNK